MELDNLELGSPQPGCSELDRPALDGSQLDDSPLDNSLLDNSQLDDSKLNDSELNDSELNDSELNDSELNDSELNDSESDGSKYDDPKLTELEKLPNQYLDPLIFGREIEFTHRTGSESGRSGTDDGRKPPLGTVALESSRGCDGVRREGKGG